MADEYDENDFEEDFQEADEPEDLNEDLEEGGEGQEQVDILPADEADGKKATERNTTPYMTKYERARVLGTR